MDDKRIVELYFKRSEKAIEETQIKYGRYCYSIAYNILFSNEDSEECVNDTYLRAWNSMPPQKPSKLSSFLGRITRNLALDRYDYNHAQKRSQNLEIALEEIGEAVPESDRLDSLLGEIALKDSINSFLASLPKKTRQIFMRRYWYLSEIKDIANDFSMSETSVRVTLSRTRVKLKAHLEKEGITL